MEHKDVKKWDGQKSSELTGKFQEYTFPKFSSRSQRLLFEKNGPFLKIGLPSQFYTIFHF